MNLQRLQSRTLYVSRYDNFRSIAIIISRAAKTLGNEETWSLRLQGKTFVSFHAIGSVLRVWSFVFTEWNVFTEHLSPGEKTWSLRRGERHLFPFAQPVLSYALRSFVFDAGTSALEHLPHYYSKGTMNRHRWIAV